MVQEVTANKEACLQKTAKAITKKFGPVMKDRRCQASNKIKGEQCCMTMILYLVTVSLFLSKCNKVLF